MQTGTSNCSHYFRLLLSVVVLLFQLQLSAQLITATPAFPKDNSQVTIVLNVSKGNRALFNYPNTSNVFVHIGVTTDKSNNNGRQWLYVNGTTGGSWGDATPALKATYLGNNRYAYTINNIRSFFGVPANEVIKSIGILFRTHNTDVNAVIKHANADNSDMYIQVYGDTLASDFILPPYEPKFIRVPEAIQVSAGSVLPVRYQSNQAASLKLFLNGNEVASTASDTLLEYPVNIAASGTYQLVGRSTLPTANDADTINFFASGLSTVAPLPGDVKDGINYLSGDTSVVLVLFAPGKNNVMVIGDFNNWTQASAYQMNKTPDGRYFWLQVNGLTPATEYAYQYLIDGNLRVADYYTEKVLDPSNDPFIHMSTYPDLKAYPSGKTTGLVSVLQTRQPAYAWKVNNFQRPDKRNLLIYELLVRDFVAAHDFKTVMDSLNYLKALGINAIELMPVNEFEGNLSWGYNTSFYFAPDKYYGNKNSLKRLIDSCHSKGIAVIMDLVLNHSFGQSPMVQMYWDAANNRPAPDNPWFNTTTPHAFGFGYDFNHESAATKYFVDRVLEFWIKEYKMDGYRLDFTKGLTQKTSRNDGEFSAYDQSRVDILKRMNNVVSTASPGAYVILEHLTDNSEEKVLASEGMMLWGNTNYNFMQAAMGWATDWNFDWAIHTRREFTQPLLVSYMESHDEERLMFKNIKYGNESANYKIKGDTLNSLKRNELATAFYLTIPGPRMIWQFGELGYDYSRCYLSTGGREDGECDRKTDNKPIRWDYLQQPARTQLYDVHAKLLKLRKDFANVFTSGTVNHNLGGAFKVLQLAHADLNILVAGNFDVNQASNTVTFPHAGTWYDYFTGETIAATGQPQTIVLNPGQYRYYTNKSLAIPTGVNDVDVDNLVFKLKVYPNPLSGSKVDFELPDHGKVSLSILNLAGQLVSTLDLGFRLKGTHTVNMSEFPSKPRQAGVYFIRMNTNRRVGYYRFLVASN